MNKIEVGISSDTNAFPLSSDTLPMFASHMGYRNDL